LATGLLAGGGGGGGGGRGGCRRLAGVPAEKIGMPQRDVGGCRALAWLDSIKEVRDLVGVGGWRDHEGQGQDACGGVHDFDVVLTSMEERMAKRRGVDAGAPGVDAAKEGGEE